MSTPRPHTWDLSKHCCALCGEKMFSLSVNRDCGVAAPLEPSASKMGKMGNFDHVREVTNMIPLEPTQIAARKFRIDRSINDGTMMSETWIDAIMAEFAAAVSKNLQEELERLQSEVAVRDEWLRFIDAKDLKIYHELRNKAGTPR